MPPPAPPPIRLTSIGARLRCAIGGSLSIRPKPQSTPLHKSALKGVVQKRRRHGDISPGTAQASRCLPITLHGDKEVAHPRLPRLQHRLDHRAFGRRAVGGNDNTRFPAPEQPL